MAQFINGTVPLSYQGVVASTPPNFFRADRAPTANDTNFVLGTLWLEYHRNAPTTNKVYMLTSLGSPAATATAIWSAVTPSDGVRTVQADNGNIAVPVDGLLQLIGGTNINTSTTGNNVFFVNLNNNVTIPGTFTLSGLGAGVMQTSAGGVITSNNGNPNGTNGQLLISGGAAPAWGTLASAGGTVAISSPGNNQINLEAVGVGSGAITFHTDGVDAIALGAAIAIEGGSNITTVGTNPGPTGVITVNLDNSPSVSGSVTAGTGFVATTGGITFSDFVEGAVVTDNTGVATSITGTAGYVLTANGAGVAPSFQAVSAGVVGTANEIVLTGNVLSISPTLIAPGSITATSTITSNGDITLNSGNLNLPNTNIAGTSGIINFGGTNFINNYGTNNVFIGNAGNLTLNTGSALNNIGIGIGSLDSLTTGASNTSIGPNSLTSLSTGSNNIGLGSGSLSALDTGTNNLALGINAGLNLTGAESNNIYLSHQGVALDSGVIRIGTAGTQTSAYMAGPYSTTTSGTNRVMFVDSTGQLQSSAGTDGQVLIGATGSSPIWASLTAGTNIAITPGANSITISATGGGGGGGVPSITGTANQITQVGSPGAVTLSLPATVIAPGSLESTTTTTAGTGFVATTGGITFSNFIEGALVTDATGVTTSITGTAGFVLTANGPGVAPSFQVAGGGGGGATSFATDVGGPAAPTGGGQISFTSGSNISTNGATANTVKVNLVNSPSVSGSLTAGTFITATAGDITTTNGNHIVGNTASATTAPFVTFKKSRAGGVITSGDVLGNISFQGHDGTQYITGSQIISTNSGTVATNRIASNLQFYTHPNSTTASTLRMTIASTGAVTIASPDSGTGLTISGGGLTSTGTTTLSSLTAGALVTNNSGVVSSIPGTSGQVLISNGAGVSPSFGSAGVAGGGTGVASFTPYAVICGGTTGTGALQNVVGLGTAGQVLTSNGAGALPSWQAGGGGGSCQVVCTVNATANGQGSNAPSSRQTAFGARALGSAVGGTDSTAVGYQCLQILSGLGINNTAVGSNAGKAINNGASNVIIGSAAYGIAVNSSNNVIIGASAGSSMAGGDYNVLIGSGVNAGNGVGNFDNNIFINAGDNGVGASNRIRIGLSASETGAGTYQRTYMAGIRGITTNFNNAIAVLIDSAGQLGTVSSSQRFKENIQDMGSKSSNILHLRPVVFNYISDESKTMDYGLIAEEVKQVMPDMVAHDADGNPESVYYHKLPALLLNELIKLREEVDILKSQVRKQNCKTCS